jgi:type IV pilus assembly protein PilW
MRAVWSPVAGARSSRMTGLSLIELMVSIAIGLVITIAVVSSYIGSLGATRVSEAQVRMNEDGQAALAILAQTIRMAGNNPKQPGYANATARNPITPTFIVRGCDGTFGNITTTTATDYGALTCTGGGSPDSIAVRYEADTFNTVPNGGQATDCLGQALPVITGSVQVGGTPSVATNVTYTVADNRFYIGTSTAVTSPGLFCVGNGSVSPQRLVENVEDLQFEFGTAPITTTTLSVAGYIGATAVDALSVNAADRWSKVLTVRICVLIRSEQEVAPDTASAGYTQCGGATNASPPDLRLRKAYSTTVVLRNRQAL